MSIKININIATAGTAVKEPASTFDFIYNKNRKLQIWCDAKADGIVRMKEDNPMIDYHQGMADGSHHHAISN